MLLQMPDITTIQRDELNKTLSECVDAIARAQAAHRQLEGYTNFKIALGIICDAQRFFGSEESPRDAALVAGHLGTLRVELQILNIGGAVPTISEV
jgi:hypothetical protein